MKTRFIPAIVMLLAGAVYCVIGLWNKFAGVVFLRELFLTLIIFYVIGLILKLILDRGMEIMGNSENGEDASAADASAEIEETDETN